MSRRLLSAEPGRKAAYSKDIRWRVVWQRVGMELGFREIACNLSLSLGTVHNHFKRFEKTGDVSPVVISHRDDNKALSGNQELLLIGFLFVNSALYLSEVCLMIKEATGICVSPPTVCRLLRRHGLSRKKIRQVALQRSIDRRGRFMADVLLFNVNQLVWVDETGCDRRDQIRKFGYSLKGQSPVYNRLLHRGQRISAIGAMCTDGLLACEYMKGTVNGERFLEFAMGTLVPEMLPFDGQNPRSIVVLDNCSIHHTAPVAEAFRQVGIPTLFLPPYSPDMNPIEELFSYVKYYLKDHDTVLQAMQDPLPLLKSAFDSVTFKQCNAWIRHAGYH